MVKDECIKAFAEENKANRIKAQENEEKKKNKAEKEANMTKPDWIKLLQITFNTFIRLRDKDEPCISCGTRKPVKYDAGHYWPTTYSFLRFNEDNVHKQCSNNCNMKKHGNQAEYRIRLIKRIGLNRVEKLDSDRHKRLDLTIPEIKELIGVYKEKIKQLKNQ